MDLITGDAVWSDRRQRLHAGLSVPVLGHPGIRGGASERDAAHEIIDSNIRPFTSFFVIISGFPLGGFLAAVHVNTVGIRGIEDDRYKVPIQSVVCAAKSNYV